MQFHEFDTQLETSSTRGLSLLFAAALAVVAKEGKNLPARCLGLLMNAFIISSATSTTLLSPDSVLDFIWESSIYYFY